MLTRLKDLATTHLPCGWKEWKTAHFSRKELLRGELDPQVQNKLRYALPTVGLARAFDHPVREEISRDTS
nr:unnamed protein product [Callosobruchus analis]